ncbi:hypothetical protein OOZ15_18415 [Galbibacter sp. EGI 63066]|uniref:hypothetical protein n=1 Tax=Galbibacter sp. EGI 63066 TaxID=2993559 RepID=UPI00224897AB|nr:hypothetical protein [Galbibacter sp. EGI 63066]MCX2681932.1 hypothetical protein [Galbibacter sp. EGI 63066]
MAVTNLFIDFDHTQVNGHIHNAITRALNTGDLPQGFDREEVIEALNSNLELTEGVGRWVDKQIAKNNIEFFDSKLLAEKVKEYSDMGVNTFTLTASGVSSAIRRMYRNAGLGALSESIVPVSHDNVPLNKANLIRESEIANKMAGNQDVVSIFVDDSKKNTNAVYELPQDNGVDRMIFHVDRNGLCKDTFERIDYFMKSIEITQNTEQEPREAVTLRETERLARPAQAVATAYANDEIEQTRHAAEQKRLMDKPKPKVRPKPDKAKSAMENTLGIVTPLSMDKPEVKPKPSKAKLTVENTLGEIAATSPSSETQKEQQVVFRGEKRPDRSAKAMGTVYVNNSVAIEEARAEVLSKALDKLFGNNRYLHDKFIENFLQEGIELEEIALENPTESCRVSMHLGIAEQNLERIQGKVKIDRDAQKRQTSTLRQAQHTASLSSSFCDFTAENVYRFWARFSR